MIQRFSSYSLSTACMPIGAFLFGLSSESCLTNRVKNAAKAIFKDFFPIKTQFNRVWNYPHLTNFVPFFGYFICVSGWGAMALTVWNDPSKLPDRFQLLISVVSTVFYPFMMEKLTNALTRSSKFENPSPSSLMDEAKEIAIYLCIKPFRIDKNLKELALNPSIWALADLILTVARIASVVFALVAYGPLAILYLILGAVALRLAISRCFSLESRRDPSLYFSKKSIWEQIFLGVLLVGCLYSAYFLESVCISGFFSHFQIQFDLPSSEETSLNQLPLLARPLVISHAIFFAPLFEEIIFRGAITDSLEVDRANSKENRQEYTHIDLDEKRFKLSNWEHFVVAFKVNFLFAIIHYQPGIGWMFLPKFVYTFTLGMISSLLAKKTGNLWASTALHSTNNALAFAFPYPFDLKRGM